MEEFKLVDQIRQGGYVLDKARETLYRTYRRQALEGIRMFIFKYRGQEADAEDLLHDAFFILLEKIIDGGYKKGSLLHFWIGIARGIFQNKIKRDRKTTLGDEMPEEEDSFEPDPESAILDKEKEVFLEKALQSLGEKCFKVLSMWMEGYSMREIKDALGFSSEVMVRKTKFNCKESLVETLGKMKGFLLD